MIPEVAGLSAFGPAAVSAGLVAVYLFAGEPVVGYVLHRRFEAIEPVDPRARRWLYGRLLGLEWGLVVLVAGVVALAPQVGWAELGVAWPSWSTVAAILALGVFAALLAGTLAVRSAARSAGSSRSTGADQHSGSDRDDAEPDVVLPGPHSVVAMVPRTPVERRLFAAVAVTAGICEELLFRGFLLAVGTAAWPGAPDWLLVVVGAALFGLAHAYQGVSGVLGTAAIGVALGATYALTGSLLIPVVLHAAIDLRVLLLRVPSHPH